VTISSCPWPVDPADQPRLLSRLRFQHFKWDTWACGACLVLPELMVLSAEAHAEVVRIVEALHAALARFEAKVRGDRATLRRLGIDDALHPIIAREHDHGIAIARYDLFATGDGRWMVPEFNEDVPGGFNEAAGLPALIGAPGGEMAWAGDLRRSVVDAFAPYDRVALLYATAYSEDLQHMLALERWLGAERHHTLLASPEHVARGWRHATVMREPVDAAFRFYPGEWMPRLPNFDTWARLGGRLPLMNPIARLVRQSKMMFSVWRDEAHAADRALVDRHCPITEPFEAGWSERLHDERDRWVLKRAFGRMGDAVTIGAIATDVEWQQTIIEASKAPHEWCVQERFPVAPVDFATGPLYPAVGAFVVNGRFAGYYSRAARRPLVTHEAFHVGTVIQAA